MRRILFYLMRFECSVEYARGHVAEFDQILRHFEQKHFHKAIVHIDVQLLKIYYPAYGSGIAYSA